MHVVVGVAVYKPEELYQLLCNILDPASWLANFQGSKSASGTTSPKFASLSELSAPLGVPEPYICSPSKQLQAEVVFLLLKITNTSIFNIAPDTRMQLFYLLSSVGLQLMPCSISADHQVVSHRSSLVLQSAHPSSYRWFTQKPKESPCSAGEAATIFSPGLQEEPRHPLQSWTSYVSGTWDLHLSRTGSGVFSQCRD